MIGKEIESINIPWTDYEEKLLIKAKRDELTYAEISDLFIENKKCSLRTPKALERKWASLRKQGVKLIESNETCENDTEITISFDEMKKVILTVIKKRPQAINDLCSIFDCQQDLILEIIDCLIDEGLPINITDSDYIVYNNQFAIPSQSKEFIFNTPNPNKIKIGIISDTHFGSKSCDITALNKFYEICEREGIKYILNAGDIVDGMNVYKGQAFEQTHVGFDSQAELVINKYPKYNGILTIAIMGNHDYSFIQHANINILNYICSQRKDIINIGNYLGYCYIGNFKIALHHPDGGIPYAISYKLQKVLQNDESNSDIFVMGHLHQNVVLQGYSVPYSCMPGSFQRPTSFSTRKMFKNIIGGIILEAEKFEDGHSEYTSTWLDLSGIS